MKSIKFNVVNVVKSVIKSIIDSNSMTPTGIIPMKV